MKKAILAAALAGAMLLCACAPAATPPTASPSVSTPPTATPPAITAPTDPIAPTPAPGDPENTPSAEREAAQARTHMEAMLPILDSIVRTTGIAGDTEYAPDDPAFFWMVLYLMGNNWGPTHPFVDTGEDGITAIPARVMEEFAGAAFSGYTEFPPIPQSLQSSMFFDEENGEYILQPSDMGGTQTKLGGISTASDGSVRATVELYDGTDDPADYMGAVNFTLTRHPHADEISNSIYLYSVTGAEKVPK